ncbi:MAG: PhoPQ-activated pathogenicity-related family protein [Opitutaceae bacterium]|nr:PhoPQ-activated pathogenicity-related family protein [Verrucomicrobiales bacterium]
MPPFPRRPAMASLAIVAITFITVLPGCQDIGVSTSREQAKVGERQAGGLTTALDRYIAQPDTNYSYTLVRTIKGQGGSVHIIEMTSQAWLTTNEVDRPLWRNWVIITQPDGVTATKSLLFIGGGSNESGPPVAPDANMLRMATETRSIVTELKNVPNQPLIFGNDGKKRTEDDLIAYCWDKFLRTGDERWPTRLPMTKSAVRAMDTVQDFLAKPANGGLKIDGFIVSGGSKRGWTTWTTAAVDKRVVAIVPIVIDVLNLVPSMEHHFGAYGFWAPAVGNYTSFRIMDWMGTKEMDALLKIEDPYTYRSRFTMPKLILNACGDQFFVSDSWQFYWKDLPGEKYLRYVPNADHSMKNSDAYETLTAWYQAQLTGAKLPRFDWAMENDGSIKVAVIDQPTEVKLWQATNPAARDFRLETLGPQWTSTSLKPTDGRYLGQVPVPAKGFTAFMIELTYPGTGALPLKFTTGVRVLPDKLDHKFVPKNPRALSSN